MSDTSFEVVHADEAAAIPTTLGEPNVLDEATTITPHLATDEPTPAPVEVAPVEEQPVLPFMTTQEAAPAPYGPPSTTITLDEPSGLDPTSAPTP